MTEKFSSWKEIATHLNITVRTAQRWEKREQLPVHRHRHSARHSVYAFRSELDQWWTSRGVTLLQSPQEKSTVPRLWVAIAMLGTVTVAAGIGVWVWASAPRQPAGFLTAVPLTSYRGHEIFPAMSPDGRQVAFSWDGEQVGRYDLYVTTVGDSGVPRRLTTAPQQDFSPAWSPDGHTIAFVRRQPPNKADVLLVSPSREGAERKLSEIDLPLNGLWGHAGQGRFLTWSPDGQWLAAAATDSRGGASRLILLSAETGEKRTLTQPEDRFAGDISPSFSPDGRTLAFSRSTSASLGEIYLVDLSRNFQPRGTPRQLTSLGEYATSPAWTSDGRHVVFVSGTAGPDMRLWKIAAAGGEPEPVEFGYTPVNSLALAGRHLVFSQGSGDIDLWRVDLSTTSASAMAQAGTPVRWAASSRPEGNPEFSPDGTRIVFGSLRSGHREIYISNRDGSNITQLTTFGGPSVQSPCWSPDGKSLAFTVSSNGSVQIYVIPSEGGAPRLIHSDPSAVTAGTSSLNWSRDGTWIYFVSRRGGSVESWKAAVSGESAVQVTRNGGLAARESPDGQFMYYLKGRPPGLWRVPVGGGEESLVLTSMAGPVAFTDGGLHFITRDATSGRATLHFFSFAAEAAQPIVDIGAQRVTGGFAVSPDRRTLVYAQAESGGIDLMLVDGFQ